MGEIIEIGQCQGMPGGGGNPSVIEFTTGTAAETRQTLERIAKSFTTGDISEGQARALVYIFNGLLGYYRLESDLRIDERLEALEKKAELNET